MPGEDPGSLPPAPEEPTSKAVPPGLLIALGAIAVVLIFAFMASRDDGPNMRPINPDASVVHLPPAEPLVDFEVLSCDIEFGFATARVEFTVSQALDFVSFTGDYLDADGVSIGQGIGNASNVVPGQTYRTDVLYSLSGRAAGGTCQVRLDSSL